MEGEIGNENESLFPALMSAKCNHRVSTELNKGNSNRVKDEDGGVKIMLENSSIMILK